MKKEGEEGRNGKKIKEVERRITVDGEKSGGGEEERRRGGEDGMRRKKVRRGKGGEAEEVTEHTAGRYTRECNVLWGEPEQVIEVCCRFPQVLKTVLFL